MTPEKSHTIIINDSVTNDFVGEGHEDVKVHIGKDEAERLIGTESDGYKGPLPLFLQNAINAQKEGKNIGIINVSDKHDLSDPSQLPELLRHGTHNIAGQAGAEITAPIAEIYKEGQVEQIDVQSLSIPIVDLRRAIQKITGIDILSEDRHELERLKIVCTGTHTNIRVYDTAVTLKHRLGIPNVVVCPHLVASNNPSAQKSAIQSWFPDNLIRVMPSVAETSEFAGIATPPPEMITWSESCEIEPTEIADNLNRDQKAIIETMFMNLDVVEIKLLKGGFSGSLLFLATAKKSGTSFKPVVVKIDKHAQIKKEIDGYHKIKGLLGLAVPTFDLPVSMGPYTGITMDLAAIKGSPYTFQSLYEKEVPPSKFIKNLNHLCSVLNEDLQTLTDSLYGNSKKSGKVNPVKTMGLDWPKHKVWFAANAKNILGDSADNNPEITDAVHGLEKIMTSTTSINGDTCLCHRDFNFANHILDDRGNNMYIDLPNVGVDLLESDFAKMENEIKFVMSKKFEESDLENLGKFEEFILDNLELPDVDKLPEPVLDIVRGDKEILKMYRLLKVLRGNYLSVKGNHPDALLAYKIALLRYTTHTLSFDKRSGKGECNIASLKYALRSAVMLIKQINTGLDAVK